MTKSGSYITIADKNLLYNRQVATIIFTCGIVFKLSSLPGLVERTMHSSTLWLYLIMSAIDIFCLGLIYCFMRNGGDAVLTEKKSAGYKAVLALLMVYLCVKNVCYFAYAVNYLTVELFTTIPPYVIVIVFVLPVIYIGVKGLRTIARCSEILFILLFGIIIVNLVFLKAELDTGRNLPVFAMEPSDFFKQGLKYGLWLGDLFPLIFVKMERTKTPFIGISVTLSYALVAIIAMLGISLYGNSLQFVNNVLIRIAGFNQLSLDIGRMEWTALFTVIIMVMLEMSFLFWGAAECSQRIFNDKKIFQIVFSIVLVAVPIAVPSVQQIIDFTITEFGYAMLAASLLIILSLIFLYGRHRGSEKSNQATDNGESVALSAGNYPAELADDVAEAGNE